MKIRRLGPGDGTIWRHAVEELVPAVDRAGRLLDEAQAEVILEDPRCYLVVARLEGEVAGMVSAFRFPDVEGGGSRVYLYAIEVRPSLRRRGVGKALVAHLRSLCEGDGVDLIWAGTDVKNVAARRTFESTGAQVAGESYAEYEWRLGKSDRDARPAPTGADDEGSSPWEDRE